MLHQKRKHSGRTEADFAPLLRRLALFLVVGYLAATVLFYFLAGEQLHLRESRGDLELLTADSGTVELAAGSVVEQTFTTEIQRLEKISVQWGTYYRPNAGTVVLELYDTRSNTLLMSKSFDAAAVTEGGFTEMEAEAPIEGLYNAPLLLRIYSPDSQAGSAVSPLMNTQAKEEGFSLTLNGAPTPGILCFTASGTDYIWTGLHYWEFVAAGLAVILLFLDAVWYRARSGKHSYVVNAVIAVQKYRFLIHQLVARDFKTKYKRSIELEREILSHLDVEQINAALNLLDETRLKKGRIYICGNGGSAATASHFQNDFNKGVSEYIEVPFRFCCLNDNVATVMAIANDIGYEEVFRFQLRGNLEPNDILVAISGSGNSQNVLNAAKYVKAQGNKIIGLIGYSGGKLKELS